MPVIPGAMGLLPAGPLSLAPVLAAPHAPAAKIVAIAPAESSPLAAIQSVEVADKTPALGELFDNASPASGPELVFDPAIVHKGHADELQSALAKNRGQLLSFLKENYSITEADVASGTVQLRILGARTLFRKAGQWRAVLYEFYLLRPERNAVDGAVLPNGSPFSGNVWQLWRGRFRAGLGLDLTMPGQEHGQSFARFLRGSTLEELKAALRRDHEKH